MSLKIPAVPQGLKVNAGGLGLIFLILINALILRMVFLRQFDLNFYSNFLDAAWRTYRGQRLYSDYIFYTMPFTIYTLAFFFKLCGFGKWAVFCHLTLFSSAAMTLSYKTARRYLPLRLTLLVTALTAASFYWYYPFPNHYYDAFVWGMIGVPVLPSVLDSGGSSKRILFSTSVIGVACAIALFADFGIGLVYGLVYFAALIFSRKKFIAIHGFLIGAITALLILQQMQPNSNFIFNLIENRIVLWPFIPNNSQEIGYPFLRNLMAHGYWVLFPALVFVTRPYWRNQRTLAVIFVTVYLASLLTSKQGRDFFFPTPLVGIALGLGLAILKQGEIVNKQDISIRDKMHRMVRFVTIGLAFTQIGLVGMDAYQGMNQPRYNYTIQSEPLKGWKGEIAWAKPMDDAAAFIKQYVARDNSMLVLCPLQILYALTGRDSFRFVTFHFLSGEVNAQSEKEAMVDALLITKDPPKWIIFYHEPTSASLSNWISGLRLEPFIRMNYQPAGRWGNFMALKRIRP